MESHARTYIFEHENIMGLRRTGTSSPWAVTLSWLQRDSNFPGEIFGEEMSGTAHGRGNVQGNVRIPVQDYKSLTCSGYDLLHPG